MLLNSVGDDSISSRNSKNIIFLAIWSAYSLSLQYNQWICYKILHILQQSPMVCLLYRFHIFHMIFCLYNLFLPFLPELSHYPLLKLSTLLSFFHLPKAFYQNRPFGLDELNRIVYNCIHYYSVSADLKYCFYYSVSAIYRIGLQFRLSSLSSIYFMTTFCPLPLITPFFFIILQ